MLVDPFPLCDPLVQGNTHQLRVSHTVTTHRLFRLIVTHWTVTGGKILGNGTL